MNMDDQVAITTKPPMLVVQSLTQRQYVLNPEDDWTGTTNRTERRRRQNRLNQRAYRKRHQPTEPDKSSLSLNSSGESHLLPFQGCSLLPTRERREMTKSLIRQLYDNYRSGTPRPGCLNIVTRLNVLDAFARNAVALGFTIEGLCRDELISPFNLHGPESPWGSMLSESCPGPLQPTPIQRAIIHHPWIDLLPIPRFRDNVLLAVNAGILDDDELCADLLSMRDHGGEAAQLIVWAGSWDIRGWEANVQFLRKWGWLITDCLELCQATNEWRERRGEKRLRF